MKVPHVQGRLRHAGRSPPFQRCIPGTSVQFSMVKFPQDRAKSCKKVAKKRKKLKYNSVTVKWLKWGDKTAKSTREKEVLPELFSSKAGFFSLKNEIYKLALVIFPTVY